MDVRKKALKFRPQEFDGKYKLKVGPVGQYHWHEHRYYTEHYLRVGGYLHHLADHAPVSVQKKWRKAFRKFLKLHPKF